MSRVGVDDVRLAHFPVPIRRASRCPALGPEVGNRGYSHPSGGRFRALQAILRPRIPPNRPQNAENRGESGFPGSVGLRVGDRHPVGQGSLTGGTSRLSPVTTRPPLAGRAKIKSAGSPATTGQRSVAATESGSGARRRPRLRQRGGKTGGLRGASAPPCQAAMFNVASAGLRPLTVVSQHPTGPASAVPATGRRERSSSTARAVATTLPTRKPNGCHPRFGRLAVRPGASAIRRCCPAAERYSLPNSLSASHDSLHWSMSVSERSRYFHCAGVWPEPFT